MTDKNPYGLRSELTKELYNQCNRKYPAMQCAKALSVCKGDIEKAIVWLEFHPGFYI